MSLPRLIALLALPVLVACSPKSHDLKHPEVVPGYEAIEDDTFHIPAVPPQYLIPEHRRAEVAYNGEDRPNSIVVDVYARKLYWVLPDGKAIRYAIAVGREGTAFRGSARVGRKAEWPAWTPTANMVRTRPDLYAEYRNGLPGGLENPLGSRALYLYRGNRDTMFRIHGTIDNGSVGLATSAGCIRLFNQDVIDLYGRADTGTPVRVRTLDESLALEGKQMDDAWGRAVPETPENIEKKARDEAAIAKAEEKAAKAAAKAEAKRLRACSRKGIAAADCPAPAEVSAAG